MPFEMKESGLQAFGVKRGAFENARELLSQKYPQHFYDYTDLDHFTFEKFKVIDSGGNEVELGEKKGEITQT
jgi:hypothetical protein